MKYSSHLVILFLLVFSACTEKTGSGLGSGAKILFNGNIFTADSSQPWVEAIAIDADTIAGAGTLEELKRIMGADVTPIDLEGSVVLPGFVDSHTHAIKGGLSLLIPNLEENYLAPDSLYRYAKQLLTDKKNLTAGILLIYGVNITTWSAIDTLSVLFSRDEFREQPVLLRGSDGHTAWGNPALLEKAGIDKAWIASLPPSSRKYYGRKEGIPTGFVADSGMARLFALVPDHSFDYHAAAEKAVAHNNRLGITAWLDPAAADLSDSVTIYLDAYRYLQSKGVLHAHVAATLVADANASSRNQLNRLRTLQKEFDNDRLSIIGYKIFADGVLEYPTQTAALSIPYRNSGEKGNRLFEPERFAQFAIAADKENLLVHVHAIGDRAVTETLNGFAAVRSENGNSGIPHTITHLQLIRPSDFDRFKKLDILASFQLLWAFGDATAIDIVQPYIDSSLFRWQYPAYSLYQSGATICGASDWPVSSANPFEAIARAETRKGPLGVLDSTQRMPRMAMFYAYTLHAARALRMEKQIGSLQTGKKADMILVDRDIRNVSPEELAATKIVWTLFEGKPVYQRGH